MLLTKALIWRFFIAIPVGMFIVYMYLGEITKSLELTIVINIVSTILYYMYDVIWFKYFPPKQKAIQSTVQ